MNKSFRTFLKHTAKDYYNQSVNPPVVRASTIIFKTMNELRRTQAKTDLYESIKSEIINKNVVYVSSKYLIEVLNNDVAKKLFNCTEHTILDALYDYIDIFESNIKESVFIEQTTKIKNTLQIIKNFNSKYKFTISFNSLKDFFNDIIKNQSISFYGDPTHSFHVMGLLESRGMDFHNVIICSANEGVLPSNNFHGSLIPFDLRKKYNLTTIIEDDARTSYEWYFRRCKSIGFWKVYSRPFLWCFAFRLWS